MAVIPLGQAQCASDFAMDRDLNVGLVEMQVKLVVVSRGALKAVGLEE